jgi:hypothetical protein
MISERDKRYIIPIRLESLQKLLRIIENIGPNEKVGGVLIIF